MPDAAGRRAVTARWARLLAERPLVVLGGVLVVLILVTGIIEPQYLSVNGLRNTVLLAAPLGIMAAGQTILMLTGGIDLSVAMIATGGRLRRRQPVAQGAAIAILFGLMVGVVAGAVNGIGVGVFRVNPLIMTLAMSAILLGLFTSWAQTIFTGSTTVAPVHQGPWGRLVPRQPDPVERAGLGAGRAAHHPDAATDRSGPAPLRGRRQPGGGAPRRGPDLAGARRGLHAVRAARRPRRDPPRRRTGAVDLQLAAAFLLPSVAAAVIGGTSIFGGVGTLFRHHPRRPDPRRPQLDADVPQRRPGGAAVLRVDRPRPAWLYARVTASDR